VLDRDVDSRRYGSTPIPVLASDILRAVVAPVAPWSGALRVWDVVFGVMLLMIGGGVHLGLVRSSLGGWWLSYVLGGLVLVCGLVPGLYAVRGVVSLVVGFAVAGLGLCGLGPLWGWVPVGESSVSIALCFPAMVALPASLLLRNKYPEYMGAKVALLVAIAVALPSVVLGVLWVVDGPFYLGVAAGVCVAVVGLSLVGFMGVGATGVSKFLAFSVGVSFGLERLVRVLGAEDLWAGVVEVQAGVVLLIAGGLASKGLFAVLASSFASGARRVDVLAARRYSIAPSRPLDL